MGKKPRLMAVAILAALLPGGGHARQDQTIDSAQKFLTQVFGAGGVTFSHDGGQGFNPVSQQIWRCAWTMTDAGGLFSGPTYGTQCNVTGWDYWTAPPYTDARYASTAVCAGEMTGGQPSYAREVVNGQRKYTREQIGSGAAPLNWARIAEVKQYGLQITIVGGGTRQTVNLPSEALATRVAYAMEFLRQNCDPTAGTGF